MKEDSTTNTTASTLLRWTSVLVIAASATACADDPGAEVPLSHKVTQIEINRREGTTTDIERLEISYSGERMKSMARFYNGMPDGTADLTYDQNSLQKIQYLDGDGDGAIRTFTFAGEALQRMRYEVPGVLVDESTFAYDSKTPALQKEIAETETPADGAPITYLTRFEYDEANHLSRKLMISGQETDSIEYRFAETGELERATRFNKGIHDITYNFEYNEQLQLDEMTDTDNRRFELTYDAEGRVEEIRKLTDTGTTSYRYTYGEGEVEGWTFTPHIPGYVSELFDLSGKSYQSVSPRRQEIAFDDIPTPPAPQPVPQPQPTGPASLTVKNTSTYTVGAVRIRACGATTWWVNPIATNIAPSTNRTVSISTAGCYDFQATETNGGTWLTTGNTLEAGMAYDWTLTN